MTIILFTDASTKNGYSCWAYKTSLDSDIKTGVVKSTNSAAMELKAIVKGLWDLPAGSNVLVVTDFLEAAKIINNYTLCKPIDIFSEYTMYKNSLITMCETLKIQAIWVASSCPVLGHQDVDQASKTVLQDYLKGL